ncbi:MAG: hypothetical protein QOG41_86 [Thermoleophilaceae bacterium]|jgi:hypothetical protein|nr:hypothetical protein [Thermoleophilaceae bacterium]MEA2351231.1 hypothetical protein [Thermoleophilaceae bacterium]MEA2352577.1 hypothetical protein [Thermoleophilaceae bacterium]MEA2369548.1 hypothetical protein [Thermoleophilaceae bacterium]MEA2378871.1 hypothetical protein [Thermoleophilaceae bacterium]
MAPLITRLVRSVVLREGRELGTCLVCHRAVRERADAVSLSGGGYVHHGCATYRMRQRYARPRRPGPVSQPRNHRRTARP